MKKIVPYLKTIFLSFVINSIGASFANNTSNTSRKYLCNGDYKNFNDIYATQQKELNLNLYPFMAAIIVERGLLGEDILQCGCVIISTKWTMTAAHCVDLIHRYFAYISSGSNDWSKGNRHDILNMVPHNNFSKSSMDYDVALIRVQQPFDKINERSISLASKYFEYVSGTEVKVLGWGSHRYLATNIQMDLEEINVSIVDQKYCRSLYENHNEVISDSQFCAGVKQGEKDVCRFDSGGPIFDENILIGIVSWGIGCGSGYLPGVYTKVSNLEEWVVHTSIKLNDPIATDCEAFGRRPKISSLKSGCISIGSIIILVIFEVFVIYCIWFI